MTVRPTLARDIPKAKQSGLANGTVIQCFTKIRYWTPLWALGVFSTSPSPFSTRLIIRSKGNCKSYLISSRFITEAPSWANFSASSHCLFLTICSLSIFEIRFGLFWGGLDWSLYQSFSRSDKLWADYKTTFTNDGDQSIVTLAFRHLSIVA